MNEQYQKFDSQMAKVLRETSSLLSLGEKEEVKEYMANKEYEAALETLIDMLSECGTPLAPSTLASLGNLAEAMELGPDVCMPLRKLKKC